MAETWLKCSACRTEIAFGQKHWVCSVSTCNRNRMRLVFCSVACWDSHLSTVRHRDAGAIEAYAPSKDAWQRELAAQDADDKPAPAAPRPAAGPAFMRPSSSGPATVRMGPDVIQPRTGPAPTSDSVQPIRPNQDATSRHLAPPPPVSTPTPSPPVRRVVIGDSSAQDGPAMSDTYDRDILIVVSKLKKYIKDRSGMNCSDAVAELLSDHVRNICDDSIRAAARDERKTVLDRDVPRPRR